MGMRQKRLRIGVIVALGLVLALCPLLAGVQSGFPGGQANGVAAQVAFTFVPHVTPLEIEATPDPFAIATIGPGQQFDGDDRPEVINVVGDDKFGYGDIPGKPDLVLIWATDENGTHYYVIEKENDLFAGFTDPATGQRFEDGFQDYVARMEEKFEDIRLKEDEKADSTRDAKGNATAAGGIGFVGAAICILATAGACGVPVLLVIVGMVAVPGTAALIKVGDAEMAQYQLEKLWLDLVDTQIDVLEKFQQIELLGSTP